MHCGRMRRKDKTIFIYEWDSNHTLYYHNQIFKKKRSKPWQQLLVQFSGNYCLIIYINGSLELKRYEKWPSHIDKLLEKGSKTVLKLPKIRICRPWKHAPILDWYRQKPIFVKVYSKRAENGPKMGRIHLKRTERNIELVLLLTYVRWNQQICIS